MGQRLVVTVRENENDICKMYYHWSAYSISALMEAREIINCIYDEDNEIEDIRLRLIRFCESNGGGIAGGEGSKEWNYIVDKFPNEKFNNEFINRNYGLIAISENGMDDLQCWSEGDIIIDIDDGSIIPNIECNPADFNYEDIEYLISAFHGTDDVVKYNDNIYALIR